MLRAVVFYVGYVSFTVVWGAISVLVAWALPFRMRFQFIIGAWTRVNLWWLGVPCRVKRPVSGRENLPARPWIVLFPEGARMPPGEIDRFQAGGGALVVAHNAGVHWPVHALAKHPGAIQLRIAPPIATAGKSGKEIITIAERTIAALMADLAQPRTATLAERSGALIATDERIAH